MASSYTHANRLLTLTTPLGKDALLIERISGFEGISEMFCYQLDLLVEVLSSGFDDPIAPKKIIGQKVCVAIQADDSGTNRYFNGIVSSFQGMGSDNEFVRYRATLVPNLWVATLNHNTRVFQNMTVTDVIKQVLQTYSISPTINTSNTYAALDYCTQYRETDFNFISRLMEQHGISYYFQHTADNHQMILVDTASTSSACPIQDEYTYDNQHQRFQGVYDYVISDLAQRSTMVPGKYTLWDHSFVQNKTIQTTQTATSSAWPIAPTANEIYDYPSSVFAYGRQSSVMESNNPASLQKFFVGVDKMAGDATAYALDGVSNAIPMQSGYNFTVDTELPPYFDDDDFDQKFILVHIEHQVDQSPPYRSRNDAQTQAYTNRFRAIRADIPYTPPIVTEKPVVHGMHSGLVVVDSGEESHMDKYGRVNVQFWWDRIRKPNTPDNTWLRVAQSWAGKQWGTYFWPRIGDEVLIAFMEGDPDQPIVVGSVYNGINLPPYDPVGQHTLSGIHTHSSKNGGAANTNELRFEDLMGSEQIYMNAEKDYTLHVEHDWQTMVGNEQHTTVKSNRFDEVDGNWDSTLTGNLTDKAGGNVIRQVGGNHTEKVSGNQSITIGGNRSESISSNANLSVGSNRNESVGSNYSLTVGSNHVISASSNFDVTANTGICLSVGANSVVLSSEGIGLNGEGGFISIGPAGVTISGMMVMINSGGAPVIGVPGMAQSPQSPDSPSDPTKPQFVGDAPPSKSQSAAGGSAGTAANLSAPPSSSSGSGGPAGPASGGAGAPAAGAAGAAAGAAGAAGQAASQASQDAQTAANQAAAAANQAAAAAQQDVKQAEQAAEQAKQEATAAVNQVMAQARQAYNQAQAAVTNAEQQVKQAAGQAKAAAETALNQAKAEANQAAQQAAAAVQQAKGAADQVEQQAQGAVNQAKAAAAQAEQQAKAAANQAKQAGQQAAGQVKQAAQQAEQQAQTAANQAKQAAAGAEQQAKGAANQVKQAAAGAQQAAQSASNAAQQSAQQAINSAKQGF
jgi:type VI secretion system secreted protein VgrG